MFGNQWAGVLNSGMEYMSHPRYGAGHFLGESDIKFIENNNVPFNPTLLRREMNSSNPKTCNQHVKIQEYLRDNYNREIDLPTYQKNSRVIYDAFKKK